MVNEKLNLILDTVHAGIWSWDVKSDKISWEKSIYKLFGLDDEKASAPNSVKDFLEHYVHPEDKKEVDAKIKEIFSSKNKLIYEITHRVIWPDQSIHHLLGRAHIDRDSEGNVLNLIGMNWDITVQKELEKERQQLQRQEQLEKFIDMICHEIRNPLLGFHGAIGELGSVIENLKELAMSLSNNMIEVKEQIMMAINKLIEVKSTSEQCTVQQKSIVDDVLDYSKLEKQQMVLHEEDFNIKELVKAVVQMFQLEIDRKELKLELELPEEDQWIKADLNRLKQVLANLLSNAIKFTERGVIKIAIALQFNITDSVMNLVCTVSDTGIGMTAEGMAKIFERFSQVDNASKKDYSGSGLGLAITKKFVELMGGKIKVASEKDKGSTFNFCVQCVALTPEDVYKKQSDNASKKHALNQADIVTNKKILVVEDNAINQKILKKILQKNGHAVTVVGDGAQAIEQCQKKHFDLIFMDVEMPVLNGIEATKGIRKFEADNNREKPMPIIGVSGNAREGKVNEAKKAGMTDYIIKPYEEQKILEKIFEFVAADDSKERENKKIKSSEIAQYPKKFFPASQDNTEKLQLDALAQAIKNFGDSVAAILSGRLFFGLNCIGTKIKIQILTEFDSYLKQLILNKLRQHLVEIVNNWKIKDIQVQGNELLIEAVDQQHAQQIKALLLNAGLKVNAEKDVQLMSIDPPKPK